MKAILFIGSESIGDIDLKIIDESMGVLGGNLIPNENYIQFKYDVQSESSKKGISNSLNYKVLITDNNISITEGIGITHIFEYEDEIIVECVGVNLQQLETQTE